MITDAEPIVITGLVVTEVLQGLTKGAAKIESYLSQWQLLEPSGYGTYRQAAAIFRAARAKGITLTTVDALIATIGLENSVTVFTLDKDFSRIALITGLPLYSIPRP